MEQIVHRRSANVRWSMAEKPRGQLSQRPFTQDWDPAARGWGGDAQTQCVYHFHRPKSSSSSSIASSSSSSSCSSSPPSCSSEMLKFRDQTKDLVMVWVWMSRSTVWLSLEAKSSVSALTRGQKSRVCWSWSVLRPKYSPVSVLVSRVGFLYHHLSPSSSAWFSAASSSSLQVPFCPGIFLFCASYFMFFYHSLGTRSLVLLSVFYYLIIFSFFLSLPPSHDPIFLISSTFIITVIIFFFLFLYTRYCSPIVFFQISSLNPLDLSWPHVLCLYAFFLIFFSFLCFFLSRLLTYFSLFESLLLSFLLSLSLPLSSLSSSSSLLWLIAALTPIVKYLHRSIADVIRADLLSAPVTWPRPTSARPGFQLPSAWRHPWLIGDVIGYAH